MFSSTLSGRECCKQKKISPSGKMKVHPTFSLGSTTIKKNPIATNAKSGHFTNLLKFVWAKFTIMNCNIQRTRTLLTSSSQKTMGLCGIFLSKLSSNVNNAGPQ